MGWSPEQLIRHKHFEHLVGIKKEPAPAPVADKPKSVCFTVPGDPMGKPRMTQRDKWQKRPAVLRYREYCDRIRAASKAVPGSPYGVVIKAHIALPESWSKKKQAEHNGCAHQTKPDWDNIGKSVCDALFKEDSILAGGTVWKYWCYAGEQRTIIQVLYD